MTMRLWVQVGLLVGSRVAPLAERPELRPLYSPDLPREDVAHTCRDVPKEENMLDHLGLRAADLSASKAFYLAALAPLGYTAVMDFGEHVGLGAGGKPDFWLSGGGSAGGAPLHIAFAAADRAAVDAFYAAALAAGGRDNGAPGPRPQYHAHYYGAFVLDPDGHNVEAVCHRPA